MLRKIETRRLTETPTNAIMAFDKEKLRECGFPAREDYNVLYEDNKITIVKDLDSVFKRVDLN